MSTRLHVLEYSSPKISEDDNTLLGVKIIGTKSVHGYTYPVAVLSKALPLYEGAPVFILHPNGSEKAAGNRQLSDHFGTLQNVRERQNGNGLYGDLAIKPAHALRKQVLEGAIAGKFGLSHNADVRINKERTEVLDIEVVNSVDLVDEPATTKTLFEGAGPQVEQLAALEARIAALESAKPTTIRRLTALEDVVNDDDPPNTPPKTGNKHEDFLSALRGY